MKTRIFTKSTAIAAVFLFFIILAQQAHAAGWQSMPSGTTAALTGIWVNSSTDIFAVGTGGTIIHYDGVAWTPMTSGVSTQLSDIWGSYGGDVYAVGGSSTLLHYNGISWNAYPMVAGQDFCAIWGSSAYNIFISPGTSQIVRYSSVSFYNETTSVPAIYGIWGSSANDVFVVGSLGAIAHYDGTSWSAMTSGTTADLYSVHGTSSSNVFAVGNSGTILHYNGVAWSAMTSPTGLPLFKVWSAGPSAFAAGAGGTVLQYGGGSWSYMSTESTSMHYGIAGISATDFYVCGDSGIMLHYTGPLCPFFRVAGSAKVDSLRQLRDDRLATALGALIASMYYQNMDEISDILGSDSALRSRFANIVMGALPDVKALVNTGSASISSDKLFEMHEFLTDLQNEAGLKLRMDIEMILRGIESGWLPEWLGVIVE